MKGMIDDRKLKKKERGAMFCPKCGHLNLEAAESCQKCGAALSVDRAAPTPSVSPAENAAGLYAGFWKRLAAFILDYVILTAIFIFTGAVIGLLIGRPDHAVADNVSGAIGAVIWWLYYAFMESSERQATLGKIAVRIKVVDRQGMRISFLRATGRHFAKLLSTLTLFIGYLMASFTSRRQALHDMVADCLVVNRAASEELIRQSAPLSRQ
jgi:uncharacterized RDD family membrane protein YckC/ribosomal protein L40E